MSTGHQCMIYAGSPVQHLHGLATVAKDRLRANWRCMYLNNPQMVGEMRSSLSWVGVEVARELERGSLVLSSSQEQLRDGHFDVDRMLRMIEDAVDEALNLGYEGLWATGDMSWEFGHEKNFAKLLEYEYALDRLFERQPALSGICQYHAETLPTDAVQWGLCTHRSVYVNEMHSQKNPHYEPATLLTYRRPLVPEEEIVQMLARPAQLAELPYAKNAC